MKIAKAHAGILCQKQKESPELLTLSPVLKSLLKISLQQPLPAPILLHLLDFSLTAWPGPAALWWLMRNARDFLDFLGALCRVCVCTCLGKEGMLVFLCQ